MSLEFDSLPTRGRQTAYEPFDYVGNFRLTIKSQDGYKENAIRYIDALKNKDPDVATFILSEADKVLRAETSAPLMKFFSVLMIRDGLLRGESQYFVVSLHGHPVLEILETHASFDMFNKSEDLSLIHI
eukprot:TRINITY_DN2587_c1_g1_i1.p1 TRINITY_DN2587_c1_g1~~TRINITY_DN2587_c1_g1_i1.p1  ORF type:complete len:129 (+),score=13.94 TRINITY_DN2587_c1_g1_i1:100-486(+)